MAVCIVCILYNEHVLFIEPNSPQKAVFIERRKGEESILAQDLWLRRPDAPCTDGGGERGHAACLAPPMAAPPCLQRTSPQAPVPISLPQEEPCPVLETGHNVHQCRLENVFF